jgi:isoleucyl-tRNA synthetase
MLHRISEVFAEVTDAYQKYEFFRVFQTVQNFCVVDLSNFYLDIAKDRLYISAPNAPRRRSCQTVLWIALENLVRAIAPILSHMAEDIWQFLPYATPYKSVFEAGWVKLDSKWSQPELGSQWYTLRQIRQAVNTELEAKRVNKEIGASLEAKVELAVTDGNLVKMLLKMNSSNSDIAMGVDELRYLFLVSQVSIRIFDNSRDLLPDSKVNIHIPTEAVSHDNTLRCNVEGHKADGHKCDRCWNYSTTVGLSQKHPLLCDRCETVIESGAFVQSEDGNWQPVSQI